MTRFVFWMLHNMISTPISEIGETAVRSTGNQPREIIRASDRCNAGPIPNDTEAHILDMLFQWCYAYEA